MKSGYYKNSSRLILFWATDHTVTGVFYFCFHLNVRNSSNFFFSSWATHLLFPTCAPLFSYNILTDCWLDTDGYIRNHQMLWTWVTEYWCWLYALGLGHEGQQVPKRIITWHVTSRADVRPDKQVSHSLTHFSSFSLSLFPFETPDDGCSCRVAYTFRNAKGTVNSMM
jgi:hypothetical protein